MTIHIGYSRRTRATLALTFTFATLALFYILSTTLHTASASGGGSLQLSTDPYTNSTSQHKTEVEPDTYSFNSTIVSAFQVGRFTNGGRSNTGCATSTDNGTTWAHGFFLVRMFMQHPQVPTHVSVIPRLLTMPGIKPG